MKLEIYLIFAVLCYFGFMEEYERMPKASTNIATKPDSCTIHYDSCFNRRLYSYVDTKPEFPGGQMSAYQFVMKRLRFSEEEFAENEGRLYAEFVIETDGKIKDVKIRSKCKCNLTSLEKKLVDIVKKMPLWVPGQCKGEKVPVLYKLPIVF